VIRIGPAPPTEKLKLPSAAMRPSRMLTGGSSLGSTASVPLSELPVCWSRRSPRRVPVPVENRTYQRPAIGAWAAAVPAARPNSVSRSATRAALRPA